MTWKPKSTVAKPPAHKAGGFKPPRPKRRKPPIAMSDEQRAALSLAEETARYKKRFAERYSLAKTVSVEQLRYLADILQVHRYSQLLTFVEWSNQVPPGAGSRTPKQGKVFLSRIYWGRAIDMALKGYCDLWSCEDLAAVAMGYEDYNTFLKEYLQPSLALPEPK